MEEFFNGGLTRFEHQVQLLMQVFARQVVSEAELEGVEEFGIVADLHPFRMEVTAINEYLDFAVYSLHTRELFAFARVHRTSRQILYSLRPHVLADSLRQLLSAGSFKL